MKRRLVPEIMDDPALDRAEHARALAGLARLNRLSRAAVPLARQVIRLASSLERPVRLLDIATGSGDVPLALASRAQAAGVKLELHACDISDVALHHAEDRAERAGVGIQTHRLDCTREPLPGGFDVVTCSLFLHHLTPEDAVRVLERAAGATERTLLISDLRRDPVGMALAWAASRSVTASRVVRVDALRSVRAAFSIAELGELANQARIEGATIRPVWPRRMLLRWERP